MKNQIFLLSIATMVAFSSAFADDRGNAGDASEGKANTRSCSEVVRACLALTGNERSNCFHESAEAQSCSGKELGSLAFRRWAMDSSNPAGQEVMGLLGPQLVDSECLANFDNQLSSSLILGDTSGATITALSARLDSCRQSPADQMFRQ